MSENKPRVRTPAAAVQKELGKVRRQFPRLADQPGAANVMHRLARQRCRYAELSALIEEAGGASASNLEAVAEARQLSRSCSALEAQLRGWLTPIDATADVIALMAQARARLLANGRGAIEAEPAEAIPALVSAALLARRDE